MAGDDHSALACFAGGREPLQLGLEEVELLVAGERGIVAALGRDHAWALEDVRVEADDRDERGVEGEVDARLVHRRADERSPRRETGAGSPAQKLRRNAVRRRDLRQVFVLAEDHAVVVAGDREDRPVVGAERLVELVVVVLALAEVVDDVAEVEEERRPGRAADVHVPRHRVGDARLVRERLRRRLEACSPSPRRCRRRRGS